MNVEHRLKELRRAQRRVGVTPQSRLAWAVALAQRPADTMTHGDWLNAQTELAALVGDRPGSTARTQASRRDVEAARRLFRRVLDDVVHRRSVSLGRHSLVLTWEAWPDVPGFPPTGGHFMLTVGGRLAMAALHDLGESLSLIGHRLKACPAPAPRGKASQRCGRWFVQRRPQQAYCSSQCQSRASTRAYRAERRGVRPRRRGAIKGGARGAGQRGG